MASLMLVCASAAHAQSETVDEGRRRFENADFYGALEVLARAEEGSALTVRELVRLYETRILVQLALGEERRIDRDLAALATIDPDHDFAPEIPPSVRARFREIERSRPGPLSVEADRAATPGGVRLDARVSGDPQGLVRIARLHARAGGGRWITAPGSLEIAAAPGERIEWHAELIGPGGAVLRQRGSREAPLSFTIGGAERALPRDERGEEEAGTPWIWIALGGAVLIGAAVAVIVIAAGDGDQTATGTRVDGPIVMF